LDSKTNEQRRKEFAEVIEHSMKQLNLPKVVSISIRTALKQIKANGISDVLKHAGEFFERGFEILEVIQSDEPLTAFLERDARERAAEAAQVTA
jgi:hypothetical protein